MKWSFTKDHTFSSNINIAIHASVVALVLRHMQTPEGQELLRKITEETVPDDFKVPEELELKSVTGEQSIVTFNLVAPGYRIVGNIMDMPVENPFKIENPYTQTPIKKPTDAVEKIAGFLREATLKPSEEKNNWSDIRDKEKGSKIKSTALSLLTHPHTAVTHDSYIIIRTEFGYHFYLDENGFPGKKIGVSTHEDGVASFFEDIERELFDRDGVISREHHPENTNWQRITY